MQTSSLSLSSEFAFVVKSSGAKCDAVEADPAFDWSKAVSLAMEHRVWPRVWRNAAAAVPQPHAQLMHDATIRNTQNSLQNIERTIEAVRLLEHHGVSTIVLKGPLLAMRLYGDYGLRVCSDVDLLVQSADFARAAETFSRAGYRHHTAINPASLQRHRKREHDVAFVHPDDGTLIELHGDVAQPHYSYRVNLNSWWQARERSRVGREHVQVLSAGHAYLLSVIHAAKHQWRRLDLICDLAAFQALPIDRHQIESEAKRSGLNSILNIGEALAEFFYLGAPPGRGLSSKVAAKVVAGTGFGRWDGMWLDVRGRERKADQVRYLVGRFIHAVQHHSFI